MNSTAAGPDHPSTKRKKTLILGIGNVLMGDEGVGVHTIRALESKNFPERIDVVDGGTGGFHLLSYFHDFDPIILIDATMDGKPAGTLSLLKPKFASDFPRSLSAHDIGLRDLVETAALTSKYPEIFLITCSIAKIRSMVMELSQPVKNAIPGIAAMVQEILDSLTPVEKER